jgi:hypothetical protein
MKKKKIISVLFMSLIPLLAFCQQKPSSTFGVSGGLGMSFMRTNPYVLPPEITLGFGGGFLVNLPINRLLSFESELNYERKSDRSKEITITDAQATTVIGSARTYYHFHYLTIPLLLQIKTGEKVRPFFNIGPYVGYLLNESSVSESSFTNIPTTTNSDYQKKLDGGLVTGLGIQLPCSRTVSISIEARNSLGLYNINKTTLNSGSVAIRTNSALLLMGMWFEL